MKQSKKRLVILSSIIFLILGVGVFLYPLISNLREMKLHENIIRGYETSVISLNKKKMNDEWKKAEEYNQDIREDYENILNLNKNGVMGYVEIPKIEVKLPIYHGTEEESLEKGVGHIKRTSLPIGGKGTHCVLTGHRGLPSAQLFTRLDELEEKDLIFIYVLDRTLVYKVDQILEVLPEEVEKIQNNPKQDYITLVTCTPYGVNTHRLLVRGIRTEYEVSVKEEEEKDIEVRKGGSIIALLLLLTGAGVCFYPFIMENLYSVKAEKQSVDFMMETQKQTERYDELYQKLKEENERLFHDKQNRLINESAYKRTEIELESYGFPYNYIGFIEIPAMEVKLPIYLGANEENMKKGVAHLTETSYPISGENTNCVLAAHRGYSKAAMFRNIERLKTDDLLFIHNIWESITYKVVKSCVISPTDTQWLEIEENKELLTLLTCHPFRHNYQRYVVLCEKQE